MLNELKNALEIVKNELNLEAVCYGGVKENDIPGDWNYIVFERTNSSRAGTSKCDFNTYYDVHIVHENYVPEGYEFKLIQTVLEKTKLRLAQNDIRYDYTKKNNTDAVIEIATVTFTLPQKGCVLLG